MKVLTVVGARPQFVKAAVVSRVFEETEGIEEILVHTGQHYDSNMSDIFFTEMNIPKPHFNLEIGGSNHGAMTGRMLEKIEEVLIKQKPSAVLVYGDTNSTIAGALAAVKLHIPVGHVEAGLRSFNMRMPEEVNRILTDRISNWLFCPSEVSVNHLTSEGIAREKIYNTGDVMYDAALFYQKKAAQKVSSEISEIIASCGEFYLATVHRAENTNDPSRLSEIFISLNEISEKTPVILPLHPRTKKYIEEFNISTENIKFIDPVGYFDMINLIQCSQGVFTDSGGLQKEAYFFEKPCITLRDETEWVETVEIGVNQVVGANSNKILEACNRIGDGKFKFDQQLYGDGEAGKKIVQELLRSLSS